MEAADLDHQLHYKYFECNQGNTDMPWDLWFGSVHDGSEEAIHALNVRRRKMCWANSLYNLSRSKREMEP